jgi:serine/threonine-protein kinase
MTPPEPTGVDALVADFIQALERGQAPSPADWLARHPAHAAELAAFLLDLGRFGSFLGLPFHSGLDATAPFNRADPDAACAPLGTGGKRFAEYELIGMIEQGGMGTVYRARLIPTSLVVALKQIRPDGLAGAEAARRFREEVETAAALRHPNIVSVYHFGEHDGQPFYTMALVERGSLAREHNLRRFQGDFRRTAELVARIARAVHHAHQRRTLHRDLKPGNILLDEDWQPQVGDFGLAGRLDESGAIAAEGSPMGSLPWMAPEAVRGDPRLTTGVDIWALGVILYELLTGARPFQGSDRRALRSAILEPKPAAPRSINPRLPRDLDAVCLHCLHEAPDQRYESANALALDLERWLRDEPVRVGQSGRAERFARWVRRHPGAAVGAAVLTACLAAWMAAGLSFARDQEGRLEDAICHGNEYAAKHVASTVQQELDRRAAQVTEAAGDRELCRACGQADAEKAAADKAAAIRKAAAVLTDRFRSAPFVSVYLLSPEGIIVAHVEPGPAPRGRPKRPVVGVSYPGRDYFQGALRHKKEPKGRDRAHLSRVFRSENDESDKLAISCVVWPDPDRVVEQEVQRHRPWVLAATITTDHTLGLNSLSDRKYTAVLLVPRDTDPPRKGEPYLRPGYVIMVHPAFTTGERSVPCPPDRPGVVPLRDGKPELRATTSAAPFAQDKDYRDPVADSGHPEFGGRMLTGSARVANTELVVLVQQRHDEAVAPHQGLFRRFVAWVIGAVAAGLVSFAVLRRLASRRAPAGNPSAD